MPKLTYDIHADIYNRLTDNELDNSLKRLNIGSELTNNEDKVLALKYYCKGVSSERHSFQAQFCCLSISLIVLAVVSTILLTLIIIIP